MAPRDYHKSSHTGRIKTARLFSNIVSPPVIFAVLGLAFALYEEPGLTGVFWAAVYGFWVSLFPILVVLYLLKVGKIKELHMTDTSERHIPYATAVAGALLAFLIITYFSGPELLRCLALFNTIELTALGLINIRWLISIHATGIMAAFLLTGLIFGWLISLILVLPLVIGVIFARLYLKRHSPAQIGAGLLLGIFSTWIMTQIGCF